MQNMYEESHTEIIPMQIKFGAGETKPLLYKTIQKSLHTKLVTRQSRVDVGRADLVNGDVLIYFD